MEADSWRDHVFFPDSGAVSVVAVYSDGSVIEMATIGREGFTGVKAVFGVKRSSARLLVQIPGSAAKMPPAAFRRAVGGGSMPSFRISCIIRPPFLERVLVSAILDAPIPGSAAGWPKASPNSSAASSRRRAETREPSCV
jgi:CRP-like cAMP-binding protein